MVAGHQLGPTSQTLTRLNISRVSGTSVHSVCRLGSQRLSVWEVFVFTKSVFLVKVSRRTDKPGAGQLLLADPLESKRLLICY